MAIQVPTEAVKSVAVDAIEALPEARGRWRAHPTLAYVARRFGLYVITLWGAFTAAFIFFRLIPGDPIGAIVAQLEQQGQYGAQGGSQAIVDYYRKTFGLDGNLFSQYVHYLNRIFLHHDFGPSIVSYPTSSQTLYPAKKPITTPITVEMHPAIAATRSEFGRPTSTRPRTSRPKRSVPSGCSLLGLRKFANEPVCSGSVSPMTSRMSRLCSSAVAISRSVITAPTRNLPLLRQMRAIAIHIS